jgi:uncharacterized membrane protein YqaE (UPF0057 family)
MKLIHYVLAIALPPIAVFLEHGIGSTLFINIGLTLLGWVPGSIHALWVTSRYYENAGSENN